MNLLTVIAIIIIILCVLRGYRVGLARGLASLLSLVVSIVLVSFLSPQVTVFLEENTPVYEYVLDKCEQTFSVSGAEKPKEGTAKKESTQAAEGSVNKYAKEAARQAGDGSVNIAETEEESGAQDTSESKNKGSSISSADAQKLLENLNLPAIVENMLLENNTPQKYAELAVASFYEYVPRFMANLVMNVISFLVTWILVLLILRIIMAVLGLVNHIPIVGGINRLLGAGFGLVEAVFIIWIAFLVITAFGSTAAGKQLLEMIGESAFLKELYQANLLMELLQNVAGKMVV